MKSNHLNEEQIAQAAEAINNDNLQSLEPIIQEHLKDCNECANEVMIVSDMIENVHLKTLENTKTNHKSNARFIKLAIGIAATITLLMIVYTLFIKNENKNPYLTKNKLIIENQQIINDTNQTAQKNTTLTQDKIEKKNLSSSDQLIAFNENQELEMIFDRYTETSMRAPDVVIISNQIIKTNNTNTTSINWKNDGQALNIEIFDNNGQKIIEKTITSNHFPVNLIKNEGLYYWKLLDSDYNLIFCGKIIYKKPPSL